jgi:hypothetical protein
MSKPKMCLLWQKMQCLRGAFPFKSHINIFRNGKNPHYTENIYSCGLNVLLDRSGHSTVEIISFFIMSGLKYHNLYMCIKAQT